MTDAYDIMLEALTKYLDELIEERQRNGFDYGKGSSWANDRRRARLAIKLRALRRAISTTRENKAREWQRSVA